MKKIYTLNTLITIVTLLSACGSPQATESKLRRETNPSFESADLNQLVNGNNEFALDIYNAVHAQNGNLILSPFSVSLALAMTYAGARGETESQMAKALHFADQNQLHPAFNALDLQMESKPVNLDKDQEPLQLSIANAVWAEQTYKFQQEYLDTIALNYGAGVNLSDFVNSSEPTRKEINNWVSDTTKDKINDLLPPNSVNPNTRMVLVNAIYFKADWLKQFEANSTSKRYFTLLDGSQIDVDMMHEDFFVPYSSGDGYQAIELPYAGETAVMDIIVPDEGRFDELESALTKSKLDEVLGGMNELTVILGLPKFTFESSFSLPDALKSLGMTDAFDGNVADFSGMTGNKDLYISDVIHKAFVAVDEEGTEAAAATAVLMEATGMLLTDAELIIDRPFIFLIRDKESGQILFIGRVLDPNQ